MGALKCISISSKGYSMENANKKMLKRSVYRASFAHPLRMCVCVCVC